ncbi:PH domain-like protein [Trichocladium antarcticum]|uniref:PH domain-like protein n=1 Tax=Trichocladium antarcticum TaxID=1450529 RepID=A0AAN6ZHX6_9PEZI|nr:PH domain-like protein [Trichocladium antarcticum]
MAQVQTQPASLPTTASSREDAGGSRPIAVPIQTTTTGQGRLAVDTYSPVSQNGCFEFDRVLKCGYVQRRTQKTKTWRTIYLVLRPNALSIYKSEKEEKLRRKLDLSELTAVTLLKDPKNKRPNVFGLFSPSKNYHFQAPTLKDAQEWVELIRQDARIDEEEDEMFLASPAAQQPSFFHSARIGAPQPGRAVASQDRLGSSSPEPLEPPPRNSLGQSHARPSSQIESSGLSGTDLATHSDFSDADIQRRPGASFDSLMVRPPMPSLGALAASHAGGTPHDSDPDRVIWQGWMWFHRSKGGVRQWKKSWAVLRPRNLILYKDDAESSVLFLLYLSSIVNVVETDPMSRTKRHCLQIITDEKSYRFCAHDEEALVRCLGAFKSLLAKRRGLEARGGPVVAATAAAAVTPAEPRASSAA